ncbi:nuclear transport factor 2 family protein [Streptomyces sp. NBC_01754]|uniref:nuclear transport factor 2 family protein n=1 Tax=Streptomyces sp. NBC_01754 TaxID=2975930 RepID=UPI0030871BB7|nr:nuclear transport factor 2 family protein [Streptomyces sp. NBC_01754]
MTDTTAQAAGTVGGASAGVSAASPAATAAAARAVVQAYWAAANARDWDAFAAVLADDVVHDLPQSRERIRGKERYVAFNRACPGERHTRIERLVADGEEPQAAARTLVTAGLDQMHAVHFFTFDAEGRITSVTDFWPEPYEPPAGREHLVERY